MKTNIVIFWVLTVFFAIVAVVYGFWSFIGSDAQTAYSPGVGGQPGQSLEWAGLIAIALVAVLSGFLAFYIRLVYKAQGGSLPEDRVDANIDDGDPEIGHFSPWSWWPILLAGAASLALLGFAVGIWITYIGAALTVLTLVGWVYEHYRGNFSH